MKRLSLALFAASLALFVVTMVFGSSTHPVRIKHVKPEPPHIDPHSAIEGRVILSMVVQKDGSVTEVEPQKVEFWVPEPIQKRYVKAAVAAVEEWQYEPATQNGEVVDVDYTVVINFQPRH